MPAQLKTQAAGRFVEVNLKIARKKFPLVSEALSAVLALAGLPAGQAEKKTPAVKTAKTAKPRKAGPSRPGKSRRAAAEKKPPSPETAALIRGLRVEAGLSQKALAVKLGVSQNQVSLLETGKLSPKPALARKLGRLLKAPIPA